MKKALALTLALMLALTFVGCGGNTVSETSSAQESSMIPETSSAQESSMIQETSSTEKASINIAVLKGPTGIGALELMNSNDEGKAANEYNFSIVTAPEDILAKVVNKEVDIAAAPTNLAATLYKKTEGQVVMLAVNALGNLYFVTKNEDISSIADLKGKTIYTAGQGATPEYVLNYLLTKNGLDPEKDVTIVFKSEHAEIAPVFATEENVIALLPEPFVTNMLIKNEGLKISINATEEWDKVSDTELVMGCLIARKSFVDENPDAVKSFLAEYERSAKYAVENVSATAELSETYGIMPKNVAEKSIPNCNITYIDGNEMQENVNEFFKVLYEANPKSVGGSIPDENLYYKK